MTPPSTSSGALRHFARFQLLRLLGKSERSMLWLAADPRRFGDVVLALPRQAVDDDVDLRAWQQRAERILRIEHAGLAPVLEWGVHDRRPFIAYERGGDVCLSERVGNVGVGPFELLPALVPVVQALSHVHESGAAHHDLQLHALAVGPDGRGRLMGLGLCGGPGTETGVAALRRAAERDLLTLGLLAHHALAGRPALDEPDAGLLAARLPPGGRDTVRLVHSGTHPVPTGLRAIVNRATHAQERLRYRSGRAFERALVGWQRSHGEAGARPLAQFSDRLRTAGVLPAAAGSVARASQLQAMERRRLDQIAAMLLDDVGLCFELLRQANSAGVRGNLAGGGNGSILTVRRAIELLGTDGVARAARTMRAWPGALGEAQAAALAQQFEWARDCGRLAQQLRPAGYDAEVVYLLAVAQRLGRLVVAYHFPEEARQIAQLMRVDATDPDQPHQPGLGEVAASCSVLGVDQSAVGLALCAQWGFDDEALLMARRLPPEPPVHLGERDLDQLRATAACANELIDARALPAAERQHEALQIVQRYGRLLHIGQAEALRLMAGEPAAEVLQRDEADADAPTLDPVGAVGSAGGPSTTGTATVSGDAAAAAIPVAVGGLRGRAAARLREAPPADGPVGQG